MRRWPSSGPAAATAADEGSDPRGVGRRLADALRAACHPGAPVDTSVGAMLAVPIPAGWPLARALGVGLAVPVDPAAPAAGDAVAERAGGRTAIDVDALVIRLFDEEGRSLVRLVRLFVDDRNAAEDLVQEGFIRLARSAHRIADESKAPAYLRSIVLNLARDHNRRGLVSLRHHLPFDDVRASMEDEIVLRDDQAEVIAALRELPARQRDCLVFRYYDELGIDDIAGVLGISRNSVKTHLKRGLAALGSRLEPGDDEEAGAGPASAVGAGTAPARATPVDETPAGEAPA